jgi:hypothetical protein
MSRNHEIKGFCKVVMLVIGVAGLASCGSWMSAPQTTALMNPEQREVYDDFIGTFSRMNFKFLSNRTFPLNVSGLDKEAPCLQGLQLEDTEGSNQTDHLLGPEVLPTSSIQLVGPKEEREVLRQRGAGHGAESELGNSGTVKDPGILALSEIVFDTSHHFAVLKYVFLCGARCNSSAIVVLEKVGSQWTGNTRRPCSFAVNQDDPRR